MPIKQGVLALFYQQGVALAKKTFPDPPTDEEGDIEPNNSESQASTEINPLAEVAGIPEEAGGSEVEATKNRREGEDVDRTSLSELKAAMQTQTAMLMRLPYILLYDSSRI